MNIDEYCHHKKWKILCIAFLGPGEYRYTTKGKRPLWAILGRFKGVFLGRTFYPCMVDCYIIYNEGKVAQKPGLEFVQYFSQKTLTYHRGGGILYLPKGTAP